MLNNIDYLLHSIDELFLIYSLINIFEPSKDLSQEFQFANLFEELAQLFLIKLDQFW